MTSRAGTVSPLTAEDLNGLNECLFKWSDSFDRKDWSQLAGNLAPTLYLDYRNLGMDEMHDMPADMYLKWGRAPHFLGNPAIKTQHLIGASYFVRTAVDEAEGYHQIRAAHQVYTDETLKTVELAGTSMGSNVHWYRKIDGMWKLAGVRPRPMWSEGAIGEIMKIAAQKEETE